MKRVLALPILSACLAAPWTAAGELAAPQRGELLYSTFCIQCHSTQAHWRDHKVARDWDGLKAQVTRWQANLGLGWKDGDEITAVAGYLNERYYHYPRPGGELSLARR